MKTRKILGILLISTLLAYQMGCKRELNELQAEQNSLSETSSGPVGEIFQTIQGQRKGGHSFTLSDDAVGELKITAYADDFLAPDFTAVDGNGKSIAGTSVDDLITLTGQIDGDPNSTVKITLNGKWMEGMIWTTDETYHIQSRYSLESLSDGYYAVEKVGSSSVSEFLPCGTQSLTGGSVDRDAGVDEVPLDEFESNATTCWKMQLRAHGDYEYYAGTANYDANLATFGIVFSMHSASHFFQTIHLDFELGQVLVFTSRNNPLYYPTASTMSQMIIQLREFHNFFFGAPTSLYDGVVLFTGKRTVEYGGLAYRGVICNYNGSYSYAVVGTRYGNGTPFHPNTVINIIGHEVGHNLGAEHTADIPPSSPCRSVPIATDDLMWMQNDRATNMGFHECARRQMNRHIWYHHDCLTQSACD